MPATSPSPKFYCINRSYISEPAVQYCSTFFYCVRTLIMYMQPHSLLNFHAGSYFFLFTFFFHYYFLLFILNNLAQHNTLQRNNIIKLTPCDETKRAHDSQIVRTKENLKLSHGAPSQRRIRHRLTD